MDPLFRFVLLGLALLGAPFLWVGASEAFEVHRSLSVAERTTATIVDNHLHSEERDGATEQTYLPVVAFVDREGNRHRFTDQSGTLPAEYSPGTRVEIFYPPAQPEKARIRSWKRLWLAPTILALVGLLPGLVGLVLFRRLSKS